MQRHSLYFARLPVQTESQEPQKNQTRVQIVRHWMKDPPRLKKSRHLQKLSRLLAAIKKLLRHHVILLPKDRKSTRLKSRHLQKLSRLLAAIKKLLRHHVILLPKEVAKTIQLRPRPLQVIRPMEVQAVAPLAIRTYLPAAPLTTTSENTTSPKSLSTRMLLHTTRLLSPVTRQTAPVPKALRSHR